MATKDEQIEIIEHGEYFAFLNSMRQTMLANLDTKEFWRFVKIAELMQGFQKAYMDLARSLVTNPIVVTDVYKHSVNLANWCFIVADVVEQHLSTK
jgi:hypothetical protein